MVPESFSSSQQPLHHSLQSHESLVHLQGQVRALIIEFDCLVDEDAYPGKVLTAGEVPGPVIFEHTYDLAHGLADIVHSAEILFPPNLACLAQCL